MSLLSTKRLKVYLGSERLVVQIQQGLLSKKILNKHIMHIDNNNSQSSVILEKLKQVLIQNNYQKMEVDVILGYPYVSYTVLKNDYRLTNEEQYTLAKHSFEAIYGEQVSNWNIFFSNNGFNKTEYVCGVDTTFLSELCNLITRQGLRVVAVTPSLTFMINFYRKLIKLDAWFILIERSCMQLVKIIEGSPVMLRSIHLQNGWESEIDALFARETLYLHDNKLPIFFCWPEKPDFTNSLLEKHNVHFLKTKSLNRFVTKPNNNWVME